MSTTLATLPEELLSRICKFLLGGGKSLHTPMPPHHAYLFPSFQYKAIGIRQIPAYYACRRLHETISEILYKEQVYRIYVHVPDWTWSAEDRKSLEAFLKFHGHKIQRVLLHVWIDSEDDLSYPEEPFAEIGACLDKSIDHILNGRTTALAELSLYVHRTFSQVQVGGKDGLLIALRSLRMLKGNAPYRISCNSNGNNPRDLDEVLKELGFEGETIVDIFDTARSRSDATR